MKIREKPCDMQVTLSENPTEYRFTNLTGLHKVTDEPKIYKGLTAKELDVVFSNINHSIGFTASSCLADAISEIEYELMTKGLWKDYSND
jgi:hypothetical protein